MITKLSVFNKQIATMGEAPFSTQADAETHPYWQAGMDFLDEASRDMQTRGYWFNTVKFDAVPVAEIVDFPCAILRVESPTLNGLSIRGLGIYDSRAGQMLTQTVSDVLAVVMLDWEDLPPNAQSYVQACAVLDFQAVYDSTRSTSERWEQKKRETFYNLNAEDIRTERHNRFLSPSVAVAISRQRQGDYSPSTRIRY